MKFLELISIDEKTAHAADLQLAAKTAALQVDFDILAAQKKVGEAEAVLAKTFKARPYSPAATVNASRDLQDANQTVSDLENLKAEYFSETTKKTK